LDEKTLGEEKKVELQKTQTQNITPGCWIRSGRRETPFLAVEEEQKTVLSDIQKISELLKQLSLE